MIKHSVLRLPVYSGHRILPADQVCDPLDKLAAEGWEVITVLPAVTPGDVDNGTWREVWLRKRDHVRGEYAREPEREHASLAPSGFVSVTLHGGGGTGGRGGTRNVSRTTENMPNAPVPLTSTDNQPPTPLAAAGTRYFEEGSLQECLAPVDHFRAGWHAALDAVREHKEPENDWLLAGLGAADNEKTRHPWPMFSAANAVKACWKEMLDRLLQHLDP